MSYIAPILKLAEENTNFRTVLHTGALSQLVVMSIPPGGDVGEEVHEHVEQTLFFLSGSGEAHLDGARTAVGVGDVVVVPPGVRHNFVNTGSEPLKIYTVYAPPNHLPARVHVTRDDADADDEDEEFGHSVRASV